MKLTYAILFLFCICDGLFAANLPPRLLLELNDDAAFAARKDAHSFPPAIAALNLPEAALVPVCYEPRDAVKHADWYAFGLHRIFRLDWRGEDVEGVASELRAAKSADIISVTVSYPARVVVQPNDYLNYGMWGLERMSCPAAWDHTTGDPGIIVTTIDTGCEIHHPDLEANIHVNPGEDLNQNGVWDASDNDGIDNDENGFIDDLSGWDFVSHGVNEAEIAPGEDYDPRDNMVYPDIHGHGTHVMGTAAGVTNNTVGVASASWNVTALPLRAGFAWLQEGQYLQGSGYDDDFIAAIQYAVDNGVRVISISFGGGGVNPSYQTIVNYARANNVLIFAAAGNENSTQPSYPGAYPGIVGVAATATNDEKADFSNYGAWVDISAPGVGIWSTMSNNQFHQQDYASWSGTSMATPNAAAVAGLVLSADPDLTVDALEAILYASADNIEVINPNYYGMLGAGRVNANTAVQMAAGDLLPFPVFAGVTLEQQTGVVTAAWTLDLQGRTDFLRYRIYVDDILDDSTTGEILEIPLAEHGYHRVEVTALFSAGESLPAVATVYWSSAVGIPFADNFETDLSGWESFGNAEIVPSPVYGGAQALSCAGESSDLGGVQHNFGEVSGVEVETWFRLDSYPSASGGSAIVAFADVEGGQSGLLVAPNGVPTYYAYPPFPPVFLEPDPNAHIELNRWYRWNVRSRSDHVLASLLDDQHNIEMNVLIPVGDFPDFQSVYLQSAFTTVPSYFDHARIRPSEGNELQHFAPTSSLAGPYPVVIENILWDGASLAAGDEIGIFDNDACVGAAVCTGEWPLIVNTFMATGPLPGYTPGDRIAYRVYQAASQQEHNVLESWEHYFIGNSSFADGAFSRIGIDNSGAADDNAISPNAFALGDAYPNPFNPTATINFEIARGGQVLLEVFNTLGQRAAILTDGILQAGRHQAQFDGTMLASGLYIYRLTAGEFVAQKKMLLLK